MTGHVQDCMFTALRLVTSTGTINDMLVSYYEANGAPVGLSLVDAEREFLRAQGEPPAPLGDMWFDFLVGQVTTPGTLDDMLEQYWCDNLGVVAPSAEAAAALARYSALDATEIAAITAFVNGLNSDGVYGKVAEIYAPCLNATDFLIGFKASSLIFTSGGGSLHVPGEYMDFTSHLDYFTEDRAFDTFAQVSMFTGVYLDIAVADTTGDSELFGVLSGGQPAFFRWRGTDTTDFNESWNTTSGSPNTSANLRPVLDFIGIGLEGTTLSVLGVGGILHQATRNPELVVPATFPFQWFGRNANGVPAASAGNKPVPNRYSLMVHVLGQTDADILNLRTRSLQFLKDIGVTGVP